jgi:hypothetical protein
MKRYLVLFITLWFFILALPSLSPGNDELTNNQGEGKQTEDKTLRFAIGLRSIYYHLTQPTRTIAGNMADLDEEQNYLPVNPMFSFLF